MVSLFQGKYFKLNNTLHVNDDILFHNKDFDKVEFIANQRHFYAVDIDKINLANDNNFAEDEPDRIIHVRLLAWRTKFKKRKALKKKKCDELMRGML